MSDYERHMYNVKKLLAMVIAAVLIVAGAVAVAAVLVWPLGLWWFLGQPLSLAVALTIVWIAALL